MPAASTPAQPFTITTNRFPNFTQIPNEVFDHLMYELPPSVFKVYMFLCRRVFGFHKEADQISLNQIQKGITTKDGRVLCKGTGLSKSTVCRALDTLEHEEKLLVRENVQSSIYGHEANRYFLIIPYYNHQGERLPLPQSEPPPLSQNETSPLSQNETYKINKKQNKQQHVAVAAKAKKRATSPKAAAAPKEPNPALQILLTEKGIGRQVAKRLSRDHSEKHIREKIAYQEFLLAQQPTLLKRPVAWLRRAIEEDYAPPDGYKSPEQIVQEEQNAQAAQTAVKRRLATEEKRRIQAQQKRENDTAERVKALQKKRGTTKVEREAWQSVLAALQMQQPKSFKVALLKKCQVLSLEKNNAVFVTANKVARKLITGELKMQVIDQLRKKRPITQLECMLLQLEEESAE